MGQVEANHTAFIRIKTEQTEDSESDFHILPVEVEVSSGKLARTTSFVGLQWHRLRFPPPPLCI